MVFDFKGKTALVVGGSSGIGNGIAQGLSGAGARVHVWGTRSTEADYGEVPGSNLAGLHYRQIDAVDVAMVHAAAAQFETLDVLVLSQGGPVHDRAEYDLDVFNQVIALNLASVMRCLSAFRPHLAASRGAVVVVGSVAARHGSSDYPAYASAKAGVARLVEILAKDWATDGIRVNSIAPGLVLTKASKSARDPALLERAKNLIPLGRPGTPVEMANAALFLASPLAAYITGQTLAVDGGLTI